MYYATDPDGGKGMAITMAESLVPYNFTPAPHFLLREEGYAAIDPFVLDYKQEKWLFWGSHHQPIRCQKLHACGYQFAKGSAPREVLRPSGRRYEKLIEGFFICRHPSEELYYAFVSGDNTWDPSKYAVSVFCSTSPFGPFEWLKVLLAPTSRWWATGQNSVVRHGSEYYFFLSRCR